MNETQKKLKETNLNPKRQQQFRDERKTKLAKLDDESRKRLIGSSTVLEPGRPPTDIASLIEAIGGSAADERQSVSDTHGQDTGQINSGTSKTRLSTATVISLLGIVVEIIEDNAG